MAPWWLRASDDEQLADSPAELEAFANEEDPVLQSEPDRAVASAAAVQDGPAEDEAELADDGDDELEETAESGGDKTDKADGGTRRRRRRRRRRGDGPAAAPAETTVAEPAAAIAPLAREAEAPSAPASLPSAPVWLAATLASERSAASETRAAGGTAPLETISVPSVTTMEPPPAPAAPAPASLATAPPAAKAPTPPSGRKTSPPPSPPRPASPPPRPARVVEPRQELPYSPPPEMVMSVDSMPKTYVYSMPERPSAPADERKIAMFVDFENIALGVRDSEVRTFDMTLILERLLEKGKIIVKKAYADWERYSDYKRPFHEAAIELIDIPQKFYSGKNSADIKMVVDAMDLCYSKEHLDTFVLVSGDSDFSPLVSKLKENNKYVIGLGVKNSSSSLLIDNCDEFIYYEDVWRDTQRVPRLDHLAPKEAECFQLMCESIVALLRENKEVLWGSLVKQTMQRKRPSFAEGYYGYGTFTELLEDAERKNIIRLRRDQRSGTYIVIGFVPPRSKRSSFQV